MSNLSGEAPLRFISLVVLLAISIIIVMQPSRLNWDMIPYMGIAKTYEIDDYLKVQKSVYEELETELSDADYSRLREGSGYHVYVAENKEYFRQQLPFYSVKPLFPFLIFAGEKLTTISALKIGSMLPKVFLVLVVWLGFFWLSQYSGMLIALAGATVFSLHPATLYYAGWFTPDSMAFFFMFLSCYFLFERRNYKATTAILFLLLLCRPDSIIFAGLIVLYMLIQFPQKRLFVSVSLLFLLAQYFTQSTLSGNYGWKILFHHSFVDTLLAPEDFTPTLSLTEYIQIYIDQFIRQDTLLLIWWGISGSVLAVFTVIKLGWKHPLFALLIINLTYMSSHWVIFPSQKERLLFSSYFMVAFVTILVVSLVLKKDTKPS